MDAIITSIFLILLVLVTGTCVGLAERKHKQRNYCPYCKCKDCCNIGFNVKEKEAKGTLLCMRKEDIV